MEAYIQYLQANNQPDTNLHNAFRELRSNTNAIKNSVYWLEKYINKKPQDKRIQEIYYLLLDATKKVDEAFYKFDHLLENRENEKS